MRLRWTPDELAVDQGGRFPHMNLAPQYIDIAGPERHGLSPAKATVGEELDQLCTATYPLLHRIGQLGHLLGRQIPLIPFTRLRYLHRLCRVPPDDAIVDSLSQYRRDDTFRLTHPRRRQSVRGHRGDPCSEEVWVDPSQFDGTNVGRILESSRER
jgi:hypothetical protein